MYIRMPQEIVEIPLPETQDVEKAVREALTRVHLDGIRKGFALGLGAGPTAKLEDETKVLQRRG